MFNCWFCAFLRKPFIFTVTYKPISILIVTNWLNVPSLSYIHPIEFSTLFRLLLRQICILPLLLCLFSNIGNAFQGNEAYDTEMQVFNQYYEQKDLTARKEFVVQFFEVAQDSGGIYLPMAHYFAAHHLRVFSKNDSALYHFKKGYEMMRNYDFYLLKAKLMIIGAALYTNTGNSVESLRLLNEIDVDKLDKFEKHFVNWERYRIASLKLDYQDMEAFLKELIDNGGGNVVSLRRRLVGVLIELGKLEEAGQYVDDLMVDLANKTPKEVGTKDYIAVHYAATLYFIRIKEFDKAISLMDSGIKYINTFPKKEVKVNFWSRYLELLDAIAVNEKVSVTKRPSVEATAVIAKIEEALPLANAPTREFGMNILIDHFKLTNDWESAFEYSEKLTDLKEERFYNDIAKVYELEKQLLERDAEIEKNKQELAQQELDESRDIQFLLIGLVTALTIIGFLIYLNLKNSKKRGVRLAEKNALINEQKDRIENLNELQKQFFINVSHEFRTPLTLVLGNLGSLLNGRFGKLSPGQNNALSQAKENSMRLLNLVREMLNLSKLESGNEQLAVREIALLQKVQNIISLFDSLLEQKGLEVHYDYPERLDKLFLDEVKVETIFYNLIANAIKFSTPNTVIEIGLTEEGDSQCISIKNTGEGIPQKDLHKVFDKFYRAGSGQTEGSGVGLTLAKELVLLHGGKIEIDSKQQEWTAVSVKFLKGSEHFKPEDFDQSIEQEIAHIPVGVHKILVVEDNLEMGGYIESVLSKRFKVTRANNGIEALSLLETAAPDLIVTDYMMPGMSGEKFYTELRQLPEYKTTPVIFLTARTMESDKQRLLRLGVSDYILKPFAESELLAVVSNLLVLKEERNELSASKVNIDDQFTDRLKLLVLDNISNQDLSPAFLSDKLSISERSMFRKVKEATGFTPLAYVKEIRLQEARRLLETGSFNSISEVAFLVGFENLSHFSSSFKKRFGKPATDFK